LKIEGYLCLPCKANYFKLILYDSASSKTVSAETRIILNDQIAKNFKIFEVAVEVQALKTRDIRKISTE
jgi:hypothetical protein